MKQFAIIGLGKFGQKVLQLLSENKCEIIILDKDQELVEKFKDLAQLSFVADAINEETLNRNIPKDVDSVVIDFGSNLEVSVLATHYLKKMGIQEIIVRAENEPQKEILEVVGASHVILPTQEAALKVTPLLISSLLFSYMPISHGLVMAEIQVPDKYVGQSLITANLRKEQGLNVVAIRSKKGGEYQFFTPEYQLQEDDVLFVVGKNEDVEQFSYIQDVTDVKKPMGFLKRLFYGWVKD